MSKNFGDVILNSDGEAVVFWAIKIGFLLSTPVTQEAAAEPNLAHPIKSGIRDNCCIRELKSWLRRNGKALSSAW